MDTLAIVALLVIAYTYVGYPLAIALLARVRPLKLRVDPGYLPTVTVSLAAHDDAPGLSEKLRTLLQLDYPAEKVEILVYLDGASTETERRVRMFQALDPRVRLLNGGSRKGKPTAINRMRREARGEVLFMTDVRPVVDPAALRLLVAALSDPRVGCATGNLVLSGNAGAGAYWRYEKLIRGAEGRLGRLVGVTGAIYVVRKQDLAELPDDIILDDMWVPLQLALSSRKKIVFCPAAIAYDQAFEDDREFGRKARTLAGNFQLISRLPSLLLPWKNTLWFELVSHKLLRLLCPFALAVLFAASCSLSIGPSSRSETALWLLVTSAQVLFYAFAAFGTVAGAPGKIARTFVVLNVAAIVGLVRFARGAQRVTW